MTKNEIIEKYGEETYKRYLAHYREYGKKYQQKHKEKYREYSKKYYQEHKEKYNKSSIESAKRHYVKFGTVGHNRGQVRCIETGEIFDNSAEASRSLGLNIRAVCTAIHRNIRAGGYHWKYLDEQKENKMNKITSKISAVYKIVNTITGECYVGSSKDVKERWNRHKCPSRWDSHPNVTLYQEMQKYGVDAFRFQVLCPVEPEHLKQVEQELIDVIEPEYNTNRANGRKKHHCRYNQNYHKNYGSRICEYKGEDLTLKALIRRFQRAGVEHPAIEAKKYLKNI